MSLTEVGSALGEGAEGPLNPEAWASLAVLGGLWPGLQVGSQCKLFPESDSESEKHVFFDVEQTAICMYPPGPSLFQMSHLGRN